MARTRNVKPGLFQNEDLIECSFAARYLFVGLWTQADFLGRLENRPKRIKMQLLPADDIDIVALLQELADGGFVEYYGGEKGPTDPDQPYLWITGFSRHQNPHKKEVDAGSKLPAPPSERPGQDPVKTRSTPDPDPDQDGVSPGQDPDQPEANRALSLIPQPLSLIPQPESGGSAGRVTPSAILHAWNDMAVRAGLPSCQTITPKRRAALKARDAEPFFREHWREAIAKIGKSPFHTGGGARGWRATIDWFLKPGSCTTMIEAIIETPKPTADKPPMSREMQEYFSSLKGGSADA